jgi:hypothetical protein
MHRGVPTEADGGFEDDIPNNKPLNWRCDDPSMGSNILMQSGSFMRKSAILWPQGSVQKEPLGIDCKALATAAVITPCSTPGHPEEEEDHYIRPAR